MNCEQMHPKNDMRSIWTVSYRWFQGRGWQAKDQWSGLTLETTTTCNNARNNRKREDERGYEEDRRRRDDMETNSKGSDSWMTMHKREGNEEKAGCKGLAKGKGRDRKR